MDCSNVVRTKIYNNNGDHDIFGCFFLDIVPNFKALIFNQKLDYICVYVH
jgi:hypothetical protein